MDAEDMYSELGDLMEVVEEGETVLLKAIAPDGRMYEVHSMEPADGEDESGNPVINLNLAELA